MYCRPRSFLSESPLVMCRSSIQLSRDREQRYAARKIFGGADRDRTDDLRLAKPALSQLSYGPGFDAAQEDGVVAW